jgi:uncharacterized membrane protein
MHTSKLGRGELMAVIGGIIVGVSLFLNWYHSRSVNGYIGGHHGVGTYSAWDVHPITRWLMLAGAIAPLILAYIIARELKLSWPRGQMTMVVSVALLGFLVFYGIINRPGGPSGEIKLRYGWFLAMIGAILMLVGSTMRAQESETVRKPPGVL